MECLAFGFIMVNTDWWTAGIRKDAAFLHGMPSPSDLVTTRKNPLAPTLGRVTVARTLPSAGVPFTAGPVHALAPVFAATVVHVARSDERWTRIASAGGGSRESNTKVTVLPVFRTD
jgi:hypothetical protein